MMISCKNDTNDRITKEEIFSTSVQEGKGLPINDISAFFSESPKATPSNTTVDGPLLGNGDMGVTMDWDKNRIRFYISKNDFWKTKPGYSKGGPRTIGGVDLYINNVDTENLIVEQTFHNATITTSFPDISKKESLISWVDANHNILFIKTKALSNPLSYNLWIKEGDEAIVDSGEESDVKWGVRKFEGNELNWSAKAALSIKKIKLNRSEELIAIAVCTNMEQEKYLEKAISLVKELSYNKIENLHTQHKKWWNDFWKLSSVKLSDSLLEKYYYASQYILASCSRNEKFPPGLFGNWITTDSPAWAGDYHLNYNYQAPFWGAYSSNHINLTECYDTPILEYLDVGKKNSREILGSKGVYYPVGIGPRGFNTTKYPIGNARQEEYGDVKNIEMEGGYMFCGQKSNALFATMNMFMRYYSTYDKDYARKILPFLLEVDNFWDDYLVFENGRYVVYNDSFHEVGPWNGKGWYEAYGDFNPILSLGMLRTFYEGILDVCNDLNIGQHKKNKWKHILDNLSALPTTKENNTVRFRACEGGQGSGNKIIGAGRIMSYGLVFPSGVISKGKTPKLFSLMQQEINRWSETVESNGNDNNTWLPMGNGFDNQYTTAARMGINPDKILRFLKKRIEMTQRSNLWIESGGGGIESGAGIVSCINEMLLKSYNDIVEVFPNWPIQKDASFHNLRAYGAFLISSERIDGDVQYIKIYSEKGENLKLINPWLGEKIVVIRPSGEEEILQGEKLEIKTSKGKKLMIKQL